MSCVQVLITAPSLFLLILPSVKASLFPAETTLIRRTVSRPTRYQNQRGHLAPHALSTKNGHIEARTEREKGPKKKVKGKKTYLTLHNQHLPRSRRSQIRDIQTPAHATVHPKTRLRKRRQSQRGTDVVDGRLGASVQVLQSIGPVRRVGEFPGTAGRCGRGEFGGQKREVVVEEGVGKALWFLGRGEGQIRLIRRICVS